MNKMKSVDDLRTLRERLVQDDDAQKSTIRVCCGTGCCASGALEAADALSNEIEE